MNKSNIYLNGFQLSYIKFNELETQIIVEDININSLSGNQFISFRPRTPNDLVLLQQLKFILDELGFTSIYLQMPYVPYARYDRKFSDHDALSLKLFCSNINTMNFTKVFIVDPHSTVTENLLDRCSILTQYEAFQGLELDLSEYSALVAPDLGSIKKISTFNKDTILCNKTRNKDGHLINFEILKTPSVTLKDTKVLIVDDICSGGGTFIGISDLLRKELQVSEVHLYVTHGLFDKGLDVFENKIDKVFCYNSWIKNDPRVVYLNAY